MYKNFLRLHPSLLLQNYQLELELGDLKIEEAKKLIAQSLNTVNSLSNTINFFTSSFKQKSSTKLDIKKLFLNIKELLKATILDYNIKLTFESEDNLNIYGCKHEFIQLMIAILNNSKEAFTKNSITEDELIEVNAVLKDEDIVITIRDNAGGIEEELMDKIFNPYFSTKRDINGTGLGLYIVKMIIEKSLKGKISINTKDNQTIVTITIPSYREL